VPTLPPNFSLRQLEALRALLVFARGHVQRWKELSPSLPFTERELSRFLSEAGRLDYDNTGDRPKLKAVFEAVHALLEADPYGLRSIVRPIFQQVYGVDSHDGWGQIEQDVLDAPPHAYQAMARRLCGEYLTYRRGTHLAPGGEIVISPMRIFSRNSGTRAQVYFEIAYPLRAGSGNAMITGRVTFSAAHFHFTGYDHGSATPYLLLAFRAPGDGVITETNGVALRCTTQATVFAARVFAQRAGGEWSHILQQAEMVSEAELKLKYPDAFNKITGYINNTIDNELNYVLRQYGRAPKI